MTTFAKAAFDSARYEAFRPRYPQSFYELLKLYIGKSEVDATMDLGCGTGVASFALVKFSKKVTALDISAKMIATADRVKKERLAQFGVEDQSRVTFKVSSVQNLDEPPNSYDLITAAQCIHWFGDFNSFFAACSNFLKPGGVLAYWYYADPIVVDFEGPSDPTRSKEEISNAAREIYHRLVYDDPNGLGPHWDQPGRNILKDFLVEVDQKIPYDKFENVKIKKYKPKSGSEAGLSDDDLQIYHENANLLTLAEYLSTYSAFHTYNEVTGKGEEFIEKFVETFENELGWDREKTRLNLHWNAGYTFLTKS